MIPAAGRKVILTIDALLRGEGAFHERGRAAWAPVLGLILASGLLYGAVMGGNYGRTLQIYYSALKLPLLLLGTSSICLANFYVLHAILGLGRDFGAALRGIFAAQATAAIALASLSPVTAFLYYCTSNYAFAILLNAAIFSAAFVAGQATLARYYKPLIMRNSRHRWTLVCWVILYIFIGIKMGHVLRPFVGDPSARTTFFRENAVFENPYAAIARAVHSVIETIRPR